MDDVQLPEFEVDDGERAQRMVVKRAEWSGGVHHLRCPTPDVGQSGVVLIGVSIGLGLLDLGLALAVVCQAVAGRSASLVARQFQGSRLCNSCALVRLETTRLSTSVS